VLETYLSIQQPFRSTQPGHPSVSGTMSTSQRRRCSAARE